jgi:phospholipid-binding lipoprotein MlaA
MNKQGIARLLCALAATSWLAGCATLPPNSPRSPHDPWERFNRSIYKFNDGLDRAILKPVAKGYVRVVPNPIRTGINNFFTNLRTPTVMINDALQGKFLAAANDLGRFLLNTTLGVGGLLDPATSAGLEKNDEDFGQTLGKWGVHAGPYLVLPFFGPSDARDAPARLVDAYTNPRQYIKNNWIKYGLLVPDYIDTRAQLLSLDATLKNVYDPYTFIRDAYIARRQYLVSDGKVVDEDPLIDPGEDLPASHAAPESAPKVPAPMTEPESLPEPPADTSPPPSPPPSPQSPPTAEPPTDPLAD